MDISSWPTPFEGLPLTSLAVVYVAYIFGFCVRGAFGFGSNLPAVIISAWVLPPHHAVLLVTLVASVMQIQLLPQGIREADWSRVVPIVGAMVIGNIIGVWALTFLEADGLLILLGVIVAVMVLVDALKLLEKLGQHVDLTSTRTTGSVAVLSSTVGTVCGGGALYLLMPFLKLSAQVPKRFRSTNIMIAGTSTLVRVLMLSAAGLITLELFVDTLVLLPAVVLGAYAGTRFFKNAAPESFYRGLQTMMLFAAVLLVGKGVATLI